MKNKNKIRIISIFVASVLLIGLAWLYFAANSHHQPTERLTYQNESVPFVFNYPKSWNIVKTIDNNNDSHIEYVVITATDSSANKKVAEIRYRTYTAVSGPDKVSNTDVDCENKKGDYEDKCSYVLNPLMDHGYFYSNVDTDYWIGKFTLYKTVKDEKVFDKTVSIALTPFGDSSSKNDLISLAESISE